MFGFGVHIMYMYVYVAASYVNRSHYCNIEITCSTSSQINLSLSLSLSLSFSMSPLFPSFLSLGTILSYFKSEEDFHRGEAYTQRFNLTGAEAIPDVDVSKKRYAMNIILPSSDETGEIRLVFENVSCVTAR